MKCTAKEQLISLFLFLLFNNPMTKSMNNLIKHKYFQQKISEAEFVI